MKTVLITGAGRGLGKALAYAFSTAGYRLILHSNRSLVPAGLGFSIRGNLREERVINALERAGSDGVDILINNAGVYYSGPFENMANGQIEEIIETNLLAPIFLIKKLLPALKKSNGLVININSIAGKIPAKHEAVYSASKHGLRGFGQSLRFEGVRVLDIYPGAMQTDMAKTRPNFDKLIYPADVANLVVKLCESAETMQIPEINLARSRY